MAEGLILQVPSALVCCGLALLGFLFDRKHRATRGILTWLSAALAITGTAFLLLAGGTLREAAAVLTVFFLLNMGVRE